MKTVTFETEDYLVPSEWNEFSNDQLVFLSIITSKECTAQEVKLKMFLFCLSAKIGIYKGAKGERYKVRIRNKTYYLNPEQVTALADAFDFIFLEADDGKVTFNVQLSRNPFPEIYVDEDTLFGPDDGLTNISYGQFIMLQAYQQRLAADWSYIDSFLSVIYKVDKFTNNPDGNAELFKFVSSEVKTVLYWYYLGSVNFIINKFPAVFSGGSDNGGGDVFDNQMRIVDAMADGDVTKKELVKQSLLYDALYTLEIGAEKENTRETF